MPKRDATRYKKTYSYRREEPRETGDACVICNTILNGIGAPAPALGLIDDWYIDTAAMELYGPKPSDAGPWPIPPTQLSAVETSPGLPLGSIQFNDGGLFGGDSTFIFNKNTNTLYVENAIVAGDLTVNGAMTTVNTVNLEVKDAIIGLGFASSSVAQTVGDRGLIMGLAGSDNAAFLWKNASSEFALGRVSVSSTGSLPVTLTSYSNLRAANIQASIITASLGFSGSLTKLANGSDYLLPGTGITLSTSSQGAITITSTATTSPASPNTGIQYNNGGSFAASSNFTYDGTNVYLTGSLALGDRSKAMGNNTFAHGSKAYAQGMNSYAGGSDTYAFGQNSFAHGIFSYTGRLLFYDDGNGVSNGIISLSPIYGDLTTINYQFDVWLHDDVDENSDITYIVTNISFIGGKTVFTLDDLSLNINRSVKIVVVPESWGFNTNYDTGTDGESSFAFGLRAWAYGGACLAHGNGVQAKGNFSHAEGNKTKSFGPYSHSEGFYTKTLGYASHSEGYLTTGSADYSHAEGYGTLASGAGAHSEGRETEANGQGSHSEGVLTVAGGVFAHTEGSGSIALGQASHAEGRLTSAPADFSHAEGYATITSGSYSHAEGKQTITSGSWSHSEGLYTVARGIGSHSEGSGSLAAGIASHAEGFKSTAFGDYSHAGGVAALASGYGSFAIGSGSFAGGNFSFAAGEYTAASGSAQVAIGKYNKHDNTDSLFIIGNGSSSNNRDDIFLVNSGSVLIGSGSLAPDTFFFVSTKNEATNVRMDGNLVVSGTLDVKNGNNESVFSVNGSKVGIGTSTPGFALEVVGEFAATVKSFIIDHPNKPGWKLRHGVLEGPENGVYVRGRTKNRSISFPEYWKNLVDENSITVNVTPIKTHDVIYVTSTSIDGFAVDCKSNDIEYFYVAQAERNDCKFVVEYPENN
jgi:hypothetical protein